MSHFSPTLQENVLTLLCFSDEYAVLLSALTNPTHFEGVYKFIASRALTYINDFHKPPGEHHPYKQMQLAFGWAEKAPV